MQTTGAAYMYLSTFRASFCPCGGIVNESNDGYMIFVENNLRIKAN